MFSLSHIFPHLQPCLYGSFLLLLDFCTSLPQLLCPCNLSSPLSVASCPLPCLWKYSLLLHSGNAVHLRDTKQSLTLVCQLKFLRRCFYVLGRAASTACLGNMASCSMCPISSSGTASPNTQSMYSRYILHVVSVHPPFVVEPQLLMAEQWEGFTQDHQLQGSAVTTDNHPLPSVEHQLCGNTVVL